MPHEPFKKDAIWIITIPSRGRLSLYGSDPDELKLTDIANALGHQCRFTGHMQPWAWYSVAEHSLDCAWVVRELGGSQYEQYVALMHDTPEFGLSDIAAPFKREVGQYYEKEKLIWTRMCDKFGMPYDLPPIVKQADWVCLFLEAMTFVVPDHPEAVEQWFGWEEHGQYARLMHPHWVPSRREFWRRRRIMRGLSYRQAPAKFLQKFHELMPSYVRQRAGTLA